MNGIYITRGIIGQNIFLLGGNHQLLGIAFAIMSHPDMSRSMISRCK